MSPKAPRILATASLVNSTLLPVVAALQFTYLFYALVLTNFLLFHSIWITQASSPQGVSKIDFSLLTVPLIAFGLFGNLSIFLSGDLMRVAGFTS